MQRRVNQANRDRKAVHGLKDSDEVTALEWKKLIQSLHTRFFGIGKDHFLDGTLAVMAFLRMFEVREEHVLGAAESDTPPPEFASFARALRRFGVGAPPQAPHPVGPLHQYLVGLR